MVADFEPWFDRDLGVAERVIIRNPDTNHVQIRNMMLMLYVEFQH